jgi:hypothetical protein
VNPESSETFRLARLVVLLAVAAELDPDGLDAERLGIYDFLAAQPLLLARDDDDPDRTQLRLAGFDDRALAYASPAQRFVTAQLALPGDLSTLVRWKLVAAHAEGRIRYRLTAAGADMAGRFTSGYSQRYGDAARIVMRRVRRLSGRRLRAGLRHWLTAVPDPPGPLLEDVT